MSMSPNNRRPSKQQDEEEALFIQSQIYEIAKMERQQKLLRQRQQQREENDSFYFSAVKPAAASDTFSQTASTIVEDDWTTTSESSSWRSLREQQQKQFELLRLQQEREAFARSKSASSNSLPEDHAVIGNANSLDGSSLSPGGNPQNRRRKDRIRPRQETSSLPRSPDSSEDLDVACLRHCLSADDSTANSVFHESYQDELSHSYSAETARTHPQQDRFSMSMSELDHSAASFLDSNASAGTTGPGSPRQQQQQQWRRRRGLSTSSNRTLPRRVVSASSASTTRNTPPSRRRPSYTRHQSQEEWQRKRAALAPSLEPVARAASANNKHAPEGLDGRSSTRVTLPTASSASRTLPAPTSPVVSNANNNDASEEDSTNFIVERVTPNRLLRKSSSGNNNNDHNGSNLEDSAGSDDYAVDEHDYVGAFYVSNVDELGNPIVPRPPSSHGRPTSIQRIGSTEDQSTITQSIGSTNTRQTMFSDEQTSQYQSNGNNDSNTNVSEPVLPPLPATIVSSTPTASTYRINLVPADGPSGRYQQQRSNDRNQDKSEEEKERYKRKLMHSFLAGLCCMLVVVGATLAALTFTLDIFGLDDPEEDSFVKETRTTAAPVALGPTPQPSAAPTLAPTGIVLPLPNFTVQAIQEVPRSPQAQAYHWFLEDMEHPNNQELPLQRQMQRFALATLYYSTNWENTWQISRGWLDHSLAECEWETVGEDKGLLAPYRICNPDTGEFESLVLSSNELKGYIPAEISFLTSLKYLDLERNILGVAGLNRGPGLPSQLGELTELEQLKLYYSYLAGAIPSELGRLTKLKVLDTKWNQLNGQIPSELGQLTNLEELLLPLNQLRGTLPSELGALLKRKLMTFNVENNLLSGSIPQEYNSALALRKDAWGNIIGEHGTNVFQIRLSNNDLIGTVPSEFCSLQQRLRFDCDAEKLCGCQCECVAM